MNPVIKEISADNEVFSTPEFIEDKYVFNYIESARKKTTTQFFSDQKNVIICHKKDHNSVWIWTNNNVCDNKELIIEIATTIGNLDITHSEFFTKPDFAQIFSDVYALVSCDLNYLVKSEFSLSCYIFNGEELRTNDETTVLKYTKKYSDALFAFYNELKDEFHWSDETVIKKVKKFSTLDTHLLLKNNKILSVCVISNDDNNSSSVRSIVTKKSVRNNGYGTIVLNAASKMSSNGNNHIMIYANKGNKSAIKTIIKAGFIRTGDVHLIKS